MSASASSSFSPSAMPSDPDIRPVVMGRSFGIRADPCHLRRSDLFTGHTMFMTHGWLQGRISLKDWAPAGAPLGAATCSAAPILAALFVAGGGGLALAGKNP